MNVLHTIIGDPFSKFVRASMEARNAKLAEQGDLLVKLTPEIEQIFMASSHVSSKRPFSIDVANLAVTVSVIVCSPEGHGRPLAEGGQQAPALEG